MTHTPPKGLQELLDANPDLVDRIFDYLIEYFPQIAGDAAGLKRAKVAVRAEFVGEETYIKKRSNKELAEEMLRLFNGRNATEVARKLGVGRATVYRYIKQAGK